MLWWTLRRLRSADDAVRRAAILRLLADAGRDDRIVPHLMAALESENDRFERIKLMRALAALGAPWVKPVLERWAQVRDYNTRTAAEEALRRLGGAPGLVSPAAVRTPFPVLDQTRRFRDGHLDSTLLTAPERDVRIAALRSLAGPPALETLIESLDDRNDGVSSAAAEALCYIGPAAVPSLTAALRQGDSAAQARAVKCLAAISGRDAIPALVGVLKDGTEEVGGAALGELRRRGWAPTGKAETLPVAWLERDQRLPHIEARHLHIGFVQLEKDSGPGGAKFGEAIQALNEREGDKALELLDESLRQGLPPSYECYAYCKLGVLSIERGNLERAVDWFLKCLGIESKTADAAWEAAIYLYNIYNEAGLYHDANAVREIADTANTRDIYLSAEAEHQIRALTKGWLAEKKPEPSNLIPSRDLRTQLLQCGEAILLIAKKPDYVGVQPGHGSKGLIIISESLEGITFNLYAAAEALQSGTGMDGQPILQAEIGSGLRRMVGDSWEDRRFRDYMKVNLSQRDYQSLCKSFANLGKCITSMAAGS